MINLKKIFILFTLFSFHLMSFTHAATAPSGGGRWTDKTVTRVGLDDIIEATARQQTIRNGSSVTLEAVVRETVNRRAVGKVLLSRLLAGGVLVGATQSLLDGIGWVMEDGVYVKYKTDGPSKDKPETRIYYKNGTYFPNVGGYGDFNPCKGYFTSLNEMQSCLSANLSKPTQYKIEPRDDIAEREASALNYIKRSSTSMTTTISSETFFITVITTGQKVSSFDVLVGIDVTIPPEQQPQKRKIVLTDDMMGDIAVGDYTDPVDKSKDKKDRKWTGVEDAYQNDPTGTGNELSDGLDDKMDAAPEKPSKPSTPPDTDGEGQKYPTDKDKGTDGKTDQEKDPTTGEPTGKGSFTLPEWCLWAADNCQWHKEDKKHQEDEKKVWEDEKKHRDDEGSFWKKITDFFADEDIDQEDPDEPDTSVLDRQFDTTFSASGSCPPNVVIPFEPFGNLEIGGDKICSFFGYLKYGVLAACSFAAMLIVGAAVRGT